VQGIFFRNTATRTRNTTETKVDYNTIQKFLTVKNLHLFTFYAKAAIPVKAIIRHFIGSISAENITVTLQEID
jgi:hypothetical protein